MKKTDILNVKINNITMDEAIKTALTFFDGTPHTVFTPNPEIVMMAQNDNELKNILNSADLLLPDGIGVVIASKILKDPMPERVPGFDFICRLLETDKSFYLLGSKPGIAEEAAKRLTEKGVKIAGHHHGYFTDSTEIIEDINSKKPDIVLVCLGAPKQEKWIAEHKENLCTSLLIGAGGTLDVLAGNVKRAPLFMQKTGTEWLYRVIKEPKRIPRIAVLPKFLVKVWRKK